MLIDIVTIFPAMFSGVFGESIIKRAQEKGLVRFRISDLRDFTADKHRKVDDTPLGAVRDGYETGAFFEAVKSLKSSSEDPALCRVILMSPGELLNQEKAKQLSKIGHLIVLCGHYEGVDERSASIWLRKRFLLEIMFSQAANFPPWCW